MNDGKSIRIKDPNCLEQSHDLATVLQLYLQEHPLC